MIAGKTESEILSMVSSTRSGWYKRISPEEKEEAMRLVAIAGRAKMFAGLEALKRERTCPECGEQFIAKVNMIYCSVLCRSRAYYKSERGNAAVKRAKLKHSKTDKFKASQKKYWQSERGRAVSRKWLQTPKGKALLKRKLEAQKARRRAATAQRKKEARTQEGSA